MRGATSRAGGAGGLVLGGVCGDAGEGGGVLLGDRVEVVFGEPPRGGKVGGAGGGVVVGRDALQLLLGGRGADPMAGEQVQPCVGGDRSAADLRVFAGGHG